MEASHKIDMNQWTTINHDDYAIQDNGQEVIDGKTTYEIGNYSALIVSNVRLTANVSENNSITLWESLVAAKSVS
jgi:hypothetical protein